MAGQRLIDVAQGGACASSPAARLLCDPWGSVSAVLSWVSYTLWLVMRAWWPLWVVAAVMALTVGAVLMRVLARRRARQVRGARFFEITAPYRFPADGARPLWRLLAAILGQGSRRARVALVWWAADDPDGRIRAGVWVPCGVEAGLVARAITRAWPGCGLAPVAPPRMPVGAVAAAELAPREGAWGPLIDHHQRPSRGVVEFEDEPLRAVLEGVRDLAVAGWFASVQVVVSPSRGTGWSVGGTAAQHAVAGWLVAGLRMVARGLLEVIELFLTPSSPSPSRAAQSTSRSSPGASSRWTGGVSGRGVEHDPLRVARQRARELKRQQGPHLRATVRLVVAGAPSAGKARRAARELAVLWAALTTDDQVRVRVRRRHADRQARCFAHGLAFVASVGELSVLWHLPHDPGRHGLAHPSAPQRGADSALPRLRRVGEPGVGGEWDVA